MRKQVLFCLLWFSICNSLQFSMAADGLWNPERGYRFEVKVALE